jgi:hypothetical protein
MAVLQICRDRTGGFFVWKLIESLCDEAGMRQASYIKRHHFQTWRGQWPNLPYDFFEVDHLSIWPWGCFCDVDVLLREVVVDVPAYVKTCRHVMSESWYFARHAEILPLFDSIVYLVRDPRDSLVSMAEFEFKPYRRMYGWSEAASPSDYIERNLEGVLSSWESHVLGFKAVQETYNIHFLHYERLVQEFDGAVTELAAHMGVPLRSDAALARIKHAVDFERMKKEFPGHLQHGRTSRYREILTARQQEMALSYCGKGLAVMGYEAHSLGPAGVA